MKATKTRQANPRTEKLSPRIRFNWGYHDGASDVFTNYVRTLTDGRQSPHAVSRTFDRAYYEGYILGLRDARERTYVNGVTLSDCAWNESTTRHLYGGK